MKCGKLTEEQSKQISGYATIFPDPEAKIIVKMWSASKILAQLQDEKGSDEAKDSAIKVVVRLYKKAIYALNAYGGDKFYFRPVHRVAIKASKDLSLLTAGNHELTEIADIIIMKINDVLSDVGTTIAEVKEQTVRIVYTSYFSPFSNDQIKIACKKFLVGMRSNHDVAGQNNKRLPDSEPA